MQHRRTNIESQSIKSLVHKKKKHSAFLSIITNIHLQKIMYSALYAKIIFIIQSLLLLFNIVRLNGQNWQIGYGSYSHYFSRQTFRLHFFLSHSIKEKWKEKDCFVIFIIFNFIFFPFENKFGDRTKWWSVWIVIYCSFYWWMFYLN